jgi:TRAP-type C4-dicarboxylate transport system permease small subunit
MNLMKLFFQKINQFLSGFCGWLMIGMMLLLVVDIIGRSINKPLQGMAELSVFVMMIVIYFGLARCEQHREHVGLELVVNSLPSGVKKGVVVFTHLLAVCTIGLLLYAVSQNAWASFQNNESIHGTTELHIWPVKYLMVAGLFFFLVQAIINLTETIKSGRKNESDLHHH